MENFNTMRTIPFGTGYHKIYTISIPYDYLNSTDKGYSFATFDLRMVACSSEYQVGKTMDASYSVHIKYIDSLIIDMYYNSKDFLNYQNNNNYTPMDKFLFVANKEVLDNDQYTKTKVLTIDIYFEADQKIQYGYAIDNICTMGRISVEDLLYQPLVSELPSSNFDYTLRKINKETNRIKSTLSTGKDSYTNSKLCIIDDYPTMIRTFEGYICFKEGIKNFPVMISWITAIDEDRYKGLTEIYRNVPILYKDGTLGFGLLTINKSSQLSLVKIDRQDLLADSIDKVYLDGVSYKFCKY